MVIWCPEGDLNPHDRQRSANFKCLAFARKFKQIKYVILSNCENVQVNV